MNGLGLLHTILCRIRNHEHLVSTIQGRIAHEYIPFNSFTGPFGLTDQEVRVRDTPSEHDFLMCGRTPMPFLGDADADSPPWAWTSMWDETYSSFYGWYMPEEAQRFGYVFWDADRLKLTGADGLLKEYWSDQWDRDPRHEFLDRYGPMEDWM